MVRAVMLKSYFSPEWRTDFEDAEAMSTALNRLGYFVPDARTGIVPFDPDHRLFTALRRFQNDHGIFGSGTAHPNDATVKALNAAIESQNESSGSYVWRGVRDGKSRSTHAAREGRAFMWNAPPEGGHPGEDYNCRCWAEPVQMGYKPPSVSEKLYPDAINPFYPELVLIPLLRSGRIASIARKTYEAAKNAKDRKIEFPRGQLQSKFKHAETFGIKGSPNNTTLMNYRKALENHVKSPDTVVIRGTYRNKPVTHYYNLKTRINVMRKSNGEFHSAWELTDKQVMHIFKDGKLGGGK